MSRHFERDFATDLLTLSAGGLSGVDGGPMTLVLVFRLDTSSPTQVLIRARTAANALVWDVIIDSGTLFPETTAGFRTGAGGLVADTWYLYAVTKPDGSATVRDHLCVMSTDTWTHADRGTPLGDGTGPVDHVRISDGSGPNRLDGYIAAAAVYTSVLNDAAIEALRSGLAAWNSAGPAAMWRLNDTPVNDLTAGGADQTAIDGTTIDLGVEPPSFSYDLGGPNQGTLAATLPALVGALDGRGVDRADLSGALPALVASLTGGARASGVLAGALPKLAGFLTQTAVQLPGTHTAAGVEATLSASGQPAAALTASGTS